MKRKLSVLFVLTALIAMTILPGCFVVRAIKGDDKPKPDQGLPAMPTTVDTNIFDPDIIIPFDEVQL